METPTIDSLSQLMGNQKGVWWAVQSCKLVQGQQAPADKLASAAAEAWVKNPNPATQAAAGAAAKNTDFQGPGAWAAQAAAWCHPSGDLGAATTAAGAATKLPGVSSLIPGAAAGSGGAAAGGGSAAGGVSALMAGAMMAGKIGAAGASGGAGAAGMAALPALAPHAVAGSVKLAALLAAGKKPPLPTMPTMAAPAVAATAPKLGLKAPALPPAPALSPAPTAASPTPQQLEQVAAMHKPFVDLGKDVLSGKNSWK